MIDLCSWRARIGIFNCRSGRERRSAKRIENEVGVSKQKNFFCRSGCDLLCFFVCFSLQLLFLNAFISFVGDIFSFKNSDFAHSCLWRNTRVDKIDRSVGHENKHSYIDLHQLLSPELFMVCCFIQGLSILRKLLLSGDVEKNPGPNEEHKINEILATVKRLEEDRKKDRDHQQRQNEIIFKQLNGLQSQLKDVYKEIKSISAAFKNLSEDIANICEHSDTIREETDKIKVDIMEKSEIIDELSRRNNLRFFGIPENDNENSTKTIVDLLNRSSASDSQSWSNSDINRAIRVGTAEGKPRIMLVTFNKWTDKLKIIRDLDFRQRLRLTGVRLSNDFTKRQTATMKKAHEEGKIAVFIKGKLTVMERKVSGHNLRHVDMTTQRDVTPSNKTRNKEEPNVKNDVRVISHNSNERLPVPRSTLNCSKVLGASGQINGFKRKAVTVSVNPNKDDRAVKSQADGGPMTSMIRGQCLTASVGAAGGGGAQSRSSVAEGGNSCSGGVDVSVHGDKTMTDRRRSLRSRQTCSNFDK